MNFQQKILMLNRAMQLNRLANYKPYPYQLKFHHATGYGTDKLAFQRFLQAANQVGKTTCAGNETAYHATGRYPDWWKGHRFRNPVSCLCGNNTNETCRDINQNELLGDPKDERAFGTGSIPKECILDVTRKAGVPDAIDSVLVRHEAGKSKIQFRAYEQGFKKFMGIRHDVIWADEEPPSDIWSQMIRSTISRPTSIIYVTYTPEEGMTNFVTRIMNDLKPSQALITATWDDAPHLTLERREQLSELFEDHEREMRTKGVPLMGSGLIFPFSEQQIMALPFEIPKHWPQIIGIDFGYDHPFGAAKLAWDRDNDTVYVVATYKESKVLPAVHTQVVNSWGSWIPVSWPHDGLNTEKGTGESLARKYKECGMNMLPARATLPPPPGKKEGEGSNSVEESVLEMYERLSEGRMKVFVTAKDFFEEQRMYHRKDGKIIKKFDDVISACRYGVMMLRHARIHMTAPRQKTRVGLTNW